MIWKRIQLFNECVVGNVLKQAANVYVFMGYSAISDNGLQHFKLLNLIDGELYYVDNNDSQFWGIYYVMVT